jgi:tyrosyl-tRNA synthetase
VSLPAELARQGKIWLPKALVAAGLASSNAEARRAVEQGGVRLDGEALTDPDVEIAVDALVGAVLQLGRRRFARIVSIG